MSHLDAAGTSFLSMRLLRSLSGVGFTDAGPASMPGNSFVADPFSEAHLSPAVSLTHDFDGDGDLDLAVHSPGPPGLTNLRFSDSTGFFPATVTSFPGEIVHAALDADGDGAADLLLVDDTTPTPSLVLRLGSGGGSFALPSMLSASFHDPYADRIAVGDADGDGDLDVFHTPAAAPGNEPTLSLNDGAGSFLPIMPFDPMDADPGPARVVHAVDLDLDGELDVTVSPAEGAVGATSIYLQSSPGPVYLHLADLVTDGKVLVDVDGDGDQDFISDVLTRGCIFAEGIDDGFRLQYGEGSPGAGGIVPVLGAAGPFRVGEAGRLVVRGTVGDTLAVLAIGVLPGEVPGFPVPGSTAWIDPFASLQLLNLPPVAGPTGVPGEGKVDFFFSIPPGFAGVSSYLQVFAVDATAPFFLTASNALQLTFGT